MRVNQYNVEDGLNQSMVTCVFKDSYGLTWIGTGSGLNYFDGKTIHSVKVEKNERPNQAIIRQIAHWDSNHLLICTSQDIGILNQNTFEFTSLYNTEMSEPLYLCSTSKNVHLYWSIEHSFFCLYKLFNHIFFLRLDSLSKKFTFEPKSLVFTKEGNILIPHASGLELFDKNFKNTRLLTTNHPPVLVQDMKNDILVIGENRIWQLLNHELKTVVASDFKKIYCGSVQKNKHLWLFDYEKMNLFEFDDTFVHDVELFKFDGKHIDTLTPIVKFIKFDEDDNLYIGTDGCGLLTHNPNHFDFQKAQIGFTNTIAASKNFIWAGTVKNGLWRMSHDLSLGRRVLINNLNEQSSILSLEVDDDNRIWILTMNSLMVLNEKLETEYFWKPNENDVIHSGRLIKINPHIITLNISRSTNFDSYSQTIILESRNQQKLIDEIKQNDLIVGMIQIEGRYWIAGRKGFYVNNEPSLKNAEKLSDGVYFSVIDYKDGVLVSGKGGFEFYNKRLKSKDTLSLTGTSKTKKIVPYNLAKDAFNRNLV